MDSLNDSLNTAYCNCVTIKCSNLEHFLQCNEMLKDCEAYKLKVTVGLYGVYGKNPHLFVMP